MAGAASAILRWPPHPKAASQCVVLVQIATDGSEVFDKTMQHILDTFEAAPR